MKIILKFLDPSIEFDAVKQLELAAWGDQPDFEKMEFDDAPNDYCELKEFILDKLKDRTKVIVHVGSGKLEFVEADLPPGVKEKLEKEICQALQLKGVRVLTGPRMTGGF